ncbi:hypothetical protein HU200_038213 [Digitaria exilis]|uniref:Uncharacterized protein n=1 Tax=Digitaria exilis TaxID=1010633 RepID=A0A835EJE7_9POAL|nr:hypothetical protein HU200_038213 [Digitaria exilis]
MFYASVSMQVGDGKNTLFWTDRWLHLESIADMVPCLSQAVGPRIRKTQTVYEALQGTAWVRDITGALTVQVILDYLCIWEMVQPMVLDPTSRDMPLWKWTTDNKYSAASAYRAFFLGQQAIPGAKILSKTSAPAK